MFSMLQKRTWISETMQCLLDAQTCMIEKERKSMNTSFFYSFQKRTFMKFLLLHARITKEHVRNFCKQKSMGLRAQETSS